MSACAHEKMKDDAVIIYTDGSCSGNPGPGGWGCLILADGEEVRISGGEAETTNNRMELSAVIAALSAVEEHSAWKTKDILVYTDSRYVRDGISLWISGWKKRGWKTSSGGLVKNRDLWMRLDALNTSLCVGWEWVRGHAGNSYNEICDSLATAETAKYLRP